MDGQEVIQAALDQALALLPKSMDTKESRVLVLAICLQESRLTHRKQIGGPAKGLAQFELGGGVKGVLRHWSTRNLAADVCDSRGIQPNPNIVYDALEHDDVLAFAFARLLLFTDPKPMPKIGEVETAWNYYIRTWRPGKPHRKTWDALYAQAVSMVNERK